MLHRPDTPRRSPAMADLRRLFPGALASPYLDTAARGLLATPVRAAMDAHADERMMGGDKARMFEVFERARSRLAELLGCAPDELAATKNISEGLNIIAAAFPWREGDNLIVCTDVEHPNNVYPWLNLARHRGVEVRRVPAAGGEVPTAGVVAAMDARTRLVTAPTTSFVPGFATDLDAIGAECRARGILFLVDAAQSAGIAAHDLASAPVDAMAISTQKGLLASYGMGFFYVRREWAERLEPVYLARFGVDLGDAHEADLGSDDYRLMPAARRFDLGNHNFPGAVALDAALDILLDAGIGRIEAHAFGLARRLSDALVDLGLPVWVPTNEAARASIVTVGIAPEDAAPMARLGDALAEAGVRFSVRQQRLRFSFHLYNDEADVDRVADVAAATRAHAG